MTARRSRTSPKGDVPPGDMPKSKTDLPIEAAINELVAKAPPLSNIRTAKYGRKPAVARRLKTTVMQRSSPR